MGLRGKATLHLTEVETRPRGIPLQIYCVGVGGREREGDRGNVYVRKREREEGRGREREED